MLKKKVCMLGSFGVGKTSLVMRSVKSLYDAKYHTTVGVKTDSKLMQCNGQDLTLLLWDMAGEETGAPVKLNQVRGAAGYFLVVDGLRKSTLDVALSIQQRVEQEIGRLPFLLLANKADERPQWEIEDSAWNDLRQRGWTVLETSAKTGANVEEAFAQLATSLLAGGDGDDE
jgi:small GTP-binding protein